MNIIKKIKSFLDGTKINSGEINTSSMNNMTVSADIISVNTKAGHYEIGKDIGQTITVDLGTKELMFVGGILVNVKEKGDNNE